MKSTWSCGLRLIQFTSGDDQIRGFEKSEVDKLDQKIKIMKHALEQIEREDYRGNRHSSHFIAKRALKEAE